MPKKGHTEEQIIAALKLKFGVHQLNHVKSFRLASPERLVRPGLSGLRVRTAELPMQWDPALGENSARNRAERLRV